MDRQSNMCDNFFQKQNKTSGYNTNGIVRVSVAKHVKRDSALSLITIPHPTVDY